MLADLYMEQEVLVRIAEEVTEPEIIDRSVRQGCLVSPLFFSVYAKAMMAECKGLRHDVRWS